MSEATAERQAREVVRDRSGGVCEVCGARRASNWHHRLNRSQGGLWCPTNGLDLCGSGTTGCHGWITEHPALSRPRGWIVQPHQDPATVPVDLAHHGRVLLLADGCLAPVEIAA